MNTCLIGGRPSRLLGDEPPPPPDPEDEPDPDPLDPDDDADPPEERGQHQGHGPARTVRDHPEAGRVDPVNTPAQHSGDYDCQQRCYGKHDVKLATRPLNALESLGMLLRNLLFDVRYQR